MAYSQAWLEDPLAIRGLFVVVTVHDVVANSEITLYLSTAGYLTTDGVTSFNPILLKSSLSVSENLSLDDSPSVSYGDVELSNATGEWDTWLDSSAYVWTNRTIKIYLGDPSWVCSDYSQFVTDFYLVFDGLVADIDSKNRDSINIRFIDKLERLNGPVTENLLGTYGTWSYGQNNADVIKPLVFGEVHNIEPLLIDPSQLEYMITDGTTESLIEIRDNAVPIYTAGTLTTGATVTLAAGKFKLTYPSAGQITASVQGVKNSIDLTGLTGSLVSGTYVNNVANLIALIVTQYGKASTKLSASDIDLANFKQFEIDNPEAVGTVVLDRRNVIEVCQELAASVGAQIYFTKQGKLQLLKLGEPTTDASVTITDSDILHHSLNISNRIPVSASTKIAYCKNWTVQDSIDSGIPQQHKDMFGTEWFYSVKIDSTVKTKYKLQADPREKETLLLTITDAAAESQRLTDYYKVPKTIYSFTGNSRLLSLKLGQPVVLIHNRFNLYNSGSGRSGQVVSLAPDWLNGTIKVGVIV